MRRSRSNVHETPGRPDPPLGRRSASRQFPDDPEISEFHLRRVMDAIPGLVWSAFPDGGVEFCNQSWLEHTGLSLDKVRGGDLADAIHPQDQFDFREKWRAALTQGASFETEARMRRADGSYRWFLIRAVPLRDATKGIIRWYGTNADIEELKRAQEEVQKQTSRLDELFEQSPEAVAVLSAEDRILRVNKEFTRIFGYTPDEVLERPIIRLIVPEALVESSRKYPRQLKQGGRVEVETVRRRKDGSEVYVSLLAVPVTTTSGEQVVNYAIYRDITERKRSEERLRESEARFQAMADTAPVLIWMTGTDGLCNYFNKPWLEFTARTMEQEVGTGWIQGVHPDDVQGCFDGFLPAFHAQKPFRMDYRLRRADGEYRWLLESGIPRYTGAGEFAGYIGSNIDITDSKRAEEKLHKAQAELAHVARVTTMGELTASIAHEVNQPLAAIVANGNACLRWLAANVPNLDEAREGARRIIRDGNRASGVISRIRALVRNSDTEKVRLNINDTIGEVIALAEGEVRRNSAALRTELADDLPHVVGDRVQLQQVILNLVMNGVEAMATVADRPRELFIRSCQLESDKVLVAVQDSGIGINQQNLEKIFDTFYSTKLQGMGMGLAISRSIVENHGGRLWAVPNDGPGATIQFTLDVDTEE